MVRQRRKKEDIQLKMGIRVRKVALLGEDNELILTEEQERLSVCIKDVNSKEHPNVTIIERGEKVTSFIYYSESEPPDFVYARVSTVTRLSNWAGEHKDHREVVQMEESEFNEHFTVIPVGYL